MQPAEDWLVDEVWQLAQWLIGSGHWPESGNFVENTSEAEVRPVTESKPLAEVILQAVDVQMETGNRSKLYQ